MLQSRIKRKTMSHPCGIVELLDPKNNTSRRVHFDKPARRCYIATVRAQSYRSAVLPGKLAYFKRSRCSSTGGVFAFFRFSRRIQTCATFAYRNNRIPVKINKSPERKCYKVCRHEKVSVHAGFGLLSTLSTQTLYKDPF